MKRLRCRLALGVGFVFITAFGLVLGIFNWQMDRQIRQNSLDSIDYILTESEELPPLTLYMSGLLFLDEDYQLDQKFVQTPEQEQQEIELARWCGENRVARELVRAGVGNRIYYLKMIPSEEEDGYYEVTVVYVDVTGEMALIRSINIAVLVVILVTGLGASGLGYLTGRQIEQSQEAQKKFFENTSHELKTPLTSIQGFAEGLLTGVMEDSKRAAKVILGETEKMTALIEDILTSARLESGTVKLNLEPVDLPALVEDCLMPLEGAVRKRHLHIERYMEPGTVTADPAQLERALNNVLTNAIKYADSQIVLLYDRKELTVWNDGDGLSDEDLRHIFDRFYTGKTGNTGIGLALTKEIAELHGWRLSVKRMKGGVGFVFRVVAEHVMKE